MKRLSFLFFIACLLCIEGQAQKTFTNPILSGFYPDPSICRAGNDYYIVNSSFAYFPGLPVFHSTDLVNWKQIGNAMDRKEQLDLTGAGVSRGLFAPTIRYHKGLFYIICTLIDKGGNFIITAKDPKGPWSNPAWLPQVEGIDPSIFFDDNGKAYIVYNSIPPDNKSLYDGHRTIRMVEFNATSLKVVSDNTIIVNGGTDISKKPVWIEAPHIFKNDGWYYLICAEGGTGYNHSEVVFRSKTVQGPYIPYEKNPILTQRHLDPQRPNPITTTGHADFVKTPGGKWYAVFLGCRPYKEDHYNTGRETFMAPVEWKDGWPHILEGKEEVQYHYPLPLPLATKVVNNNFSGNFTFRDEFKSSTLNSRYVFLRNPEAGSYTLSPAKRQLALTVKPQTASGKESPAFIGFRQQHLKASASTSLTFDPASPDEKAGLLVFQNETHYYFLCQSVENDYTVIQLYRSMPDGSLQSLVYRALARHPKELGLKIEARGEHYFFYFSPDNKAWMLLTIEGMDAKFLSTKTAGGFVGCVFALYATSQGKESSNKAFFNWFEYQGNDDIYNKP